MHTLVLNAGSSSLRFAVFDASFKEIYKGHIDAIGLKNGQAKNHKTAVKLAMNSLKDFDITRVGNRVVHGGEKFTKPVILNREVIKEIEKISALAPLHNPVNLEAIKAAMKFLPHAKHYAVFDTAFHATMPVKAKMYGLPYDFYKQGIRRYGFHGISHQYVYGEALKILKKKSAQIISCHIGNGVSVTAIKDGKSVDTSMGFTPLEGPLMGTRSGSIDPGILLHLGKQLGLKKLEKILQYESGFKGISQISSDIRDLWARPKSEGTKRTFELFSYQMAKIISSMFVPLSGKADAIIFTAGIGENAFYLRKQIMNYLPKIKVLVIKTNEELAIAQTKI